MTKRIDKNKSDHILAEVKKRKKKGEIVDVTE